MQPSRRRVLRAAVGSLGIALAGCGGRSRETTATEASGTASPATTTSATTAATAGSTTTVTAASDPDPFPPANASLPDGPRSAPERPAESTAESVREYVHDYEYADVYDHLHREDATGTRVSCSVVEVVRVEGGFAAGLQCRGNTNWAGGTTTAHADFGGHHVAYLVDGNSTLRQRDTPGTFVTTSTIGATTATDR